MVLVLMLSYIMIVPEVLLAFFHHEGGWLSRLAFYVCKSCVYRVAADLTLARHSHSAIGHRSAASWGY